MKPIKITTHFELSTLQQLFDCYAIVTKKADNYYMHTYDFILNVLCVLCDEMEETDKEDFATQEKIIMNVAQTFDAYVDASKKGTYSEYVDEFLVLQAKESIEAIWLASLKRVYERSYKAFFSQPKVINTRDCKSYCLNCFAIDHPDLWLNMLRHGYDLHNLLDVYPDIAELLYDDSIEYEQFPDEYYKEGLTCERCGQWVINPLDDDDDE